MKHLKKHARFLHLLAKAKSAKERRAILKHAKKEHLNIIREICLNLCAGNVSLSDCIKKRIKKFSRVIRSLANRKKPHKNIKRTLVMRGGFLQLLLPAILGLISTVGGRAIAKAVGV